MEISKFVEVLINILEFRFNTAHIGHNWIGFYLIENFQMPNIFHSSW